MSPHHAVHTNRARAESFGAIAADYDRYRTNYPDELFADLVDRAGGRVLDIACGTGKVAVSLAACGLAVLGVEPDPKMADVARSHGILVEVADFEEWDGQGRTFDMITCGQGWHWIDPERGARKAVEVLRPGGTLALFWSYPDVDDTLREQFGAVYRERAPELMRDASADEDDSRHLRELHDSGLFADIDTRTYRWRRSFTADEWAQRTATFSDHQLLPAEQRAHLLDGLRAVVDARGGVLDVEFGTYTILATAAQR